MKQNLEKELSKLHHRINKLQYSLDSSKQASSSRQKREDVTLRIKDFMQTTDYAYEDLHSGVIMAWDDISTAFKSARERFHHKAS